MSKVIVSFANPIGKLRLVGSGGSNPIVLSPPPPLVLSLSKDVLSSRTSPWPFMLTWRLHRVAETCDTRVVREFRHAGRGVRRRTPRERLEPRHGGGRPSTGSGRTGREAIRLTGIGVQAGIQSAGRRPSARFRIRERRRSPSRRSMSTRPPERHPGLSCHPGERWSLHNPRHPGERRDDGARNPALIPTYHPLRPLDPLRLSPSKPGSAGCLTGGIRAHLGEGLRQAQPERGRG